MTLYRESSDDEAGGGTDRDIAVWNTDGYDKSMAMVVKKRDMEQTQTEFLSNLQLLLIQGHQLWGDFCQAVLENIYPVFQNSISPQKSVSSSKEQSIPGPCLLAQCQE